MAPLFRKRQSAATLPADDSIPDDLLASIPDVGGSQSSTNIPFIHVTTLDALDEDDGPPIALPESWSAAEVLARRASREEAAAPEAPPAPAAPMPEPPHKEEPLVKETRAPRKGGKDGKDKDAPTTPATPVAAPDLTALVQDVRRQMESVFTREMGKVEDTFGATLRDLETRLERATAEAEGLRRENESLLRMKAEYDRKAEALRELARSFER